MAAAIVEMRFPDRDVMWETVCELGLEKAPHVNFYQRIIETFANTVWIPKVAVSKIDKMVVFFLGEKEKDNAPLRGALGSTSYLFLIQSIGLIKGPPSKANTVLSVQQYWSLLCG